MDEIERLANNARLKKTSNINERNKLKAKLKDFRQILKDEYNFSSTMQTANTQTKKQESKEDDSSQELKDWLKKEELFVIELFEALVSQGVTDPKTDFANIDKKKFDEVERIAKNERNAKTTDTQSRNNLQAKINDFKKILKNRYDFSVTMQTENTKNKPKEKVDDSAQELKDWLKKEELFVIELFEALVSQGVTDPNTDFGNIDKQKFDEVERIAKNERNAKTTDTQSRNNLQAKINDFKKILKNRYDFSVTMQTENTKNKPKEKETETKISEIVRWLKDNDLFMIKLAEELNKRDIYTWEDVKEKLGTGDEYHKFYQQVKLEECANEDKQKEKRVEKKFVEFEKKWREVTGVKKEIGTQKKYKKKN